MRSNNNGFIKKNFPKNTINVLYYIKYIYTPIYRVAEK